MTGNRISEIICLSLGLLLLFSCKKEESNPKLFELLSPEQTGVTFENRLESTDSMNILEYLYFYNGGGVAAGDINNDGFVDLFFSGNQVPSKLYLNKGNLQFEDISESSGISEMGGWSNGVTFADVNGDGFLDLYVSQVSGYKGIEGKNRLWINQGDLTFKEKGEEYGVDFRGFGTHAAFLDYDRDGDLDLYLLNHGVKSPEVFTKSENRFIPYEEGDKLLKNLSAQGENRFEDATQESGIYSSILGFGLGVAVEDFNHDGWPDIYVSNDFTENDYLYLNQQDGTFKESLEDWIANTSRYSMGNDAADLNGDGLPEIFTTDMLPEDPEIWMKSVGEDKVEVYQIKKQFNYADQYVRNNLQLNREEIGFSEIALYSGVFASDWSWSPLLLDMDNNGLVDIHITNGIVKRPNDLDFIQYSQEADPQMTLSELRKRQIEMLPSVKLANYTFQNVGELRFKPVSDAWGLDQPSYSNGSTYADLDNDGDLELIINNLDQVTFIYQNQSEFSGNHFLRVNLSSSGFNPFGIGAEVTLFSNEKVFRQRLNTSRGFQSGTSTTLVFGLGEIEKIDSIQVFWPEGEREIFGPSEANTSLTLEKGRGKYIEENLENHKVDFSSPIEWKHVEKTEIRESDREYLLPRSYAAEGPALAVGDVNGDGLKDLYLGGAKGQAGEIQLQQEDGSFKKSDNPIFDQLAKAEDVSALFADLNGDGNLDLYVGSGGNEEQQGNLFLFDRVFFGDGTGAFRFSPNSLPPLGENTSVIAPTDINQDGAIDLFIGASNVTEDYGAEPKSYLLVNNGKGQFQEQTEIWFGENTHFGMVNDATWVDLNGDGIEELILSGEWQGVRVFEKNGDKYEEKIGAGLESSSGWIQSILVQDINGDGLLDILTGNLGLNSKFKASKEKPVILYHADFDQNEKAEPLIFHYMGEKLVPFVTRDDLIKQIPGIKKLHPSYQEYAKIQKPEDLFSKEVLDKAELKKAFEFRSGAYLQKQDGSFEFVPFPWEQQLSPIFSMLWDQETKILYLGGNFSGYRVDLGKNNGQSVSALKWSNGHWESVKLEPSVPLQAEIRQIVAIEEQILAAMNDGPVFSVKVSKE
ncbi:VCBS repeat-containing protein [Algoriphagus limi]|uniref:VCBS repeat-containing protein n=1 Tax=Algoriphagus limi TaxID=2975273 RepID=A0ABT2G8B9_9BACT|nr:VCBS repeat-containing protein [Algoriphagus limi]MCS5491518.1 VCBS repeat-containing protein [Algoriphagus limi]